MMMKGLARDTTPADLVFCATGKSGLGHLRRVTNVAMALRTLRPDVRISLLSNARVDGLSFEERFGFSQFGLAPRDSMASELSSYTRGPVVVDTAVLPGLEKHDGPICLILRETVADRVNQFRLPGGRLWDLVCVPNPADHWMPDRQTIGARRLEAAGWIFRSQPSDTSGYLKLVEPGVARILVASGGGGNAETAAWLREEMDAVLVKVRQSCKQPIHVVQAVGPRMEEEAVLTEADECVQAAHRLNELFSRFDLVISTAGYNSVLELAELSVPVLFVPIERSLDDQQSRSAKWASLMGYAHKSGNIDGSALWVGQTLAARARRQPIALDTDGARHCAQFILEMLG